MIHCALYQGKETGVFLSDQKLGVDSNRGAVIPRLIARTDSISERRHLRQTYFFESDHTMPIIGECFS